MGPKEGASDLLSDSPNEVSNSPYKWVNREKE